MTTMAQTSRPKKPKRTIAVIDFETDPFLYGRIPKPFAAGFCDGTVNLTFWGKDCARALIEYLRDRKDPMTIYAHNGGKFDFFFLLKYLENPIMLIHGRIAKAAIGAHELRDSWLINPQPLSAYKKDEIDYSLFERGVREKHRAEIESYLAGDCKYLHEIVLAFNERFGRKLTAPGAAIAELEKIHPQGRGTRHHDSIFRPYYFGGRVEYFERGVIRGQFKVYDVNSMYPKAMADFDHPQGRGYVVLESARLDRDGWVNRFPGHMYFARVVGVNKGALPLRLKDSLSFIESGGEFWACSHELRVALRLGLFKIERILEIRLPMQTQRFTEFVRTFYSEKVAAKKAGDKMREIFAKLCLNSSYGKFAQNPDEFRDYLLERVGVDVVPDLDNWEPFETSPHYRIWRSVKAKPGDNDAEKATRGFYDVAIAASITSAARSILLEALAGAKRPVYCDTDSIICESLGAAHVDASELGAWKYEGRGDRLAIGGKKMYALFDGPDCVKWACKGVKVSPADIEAIASGSTIEWANDAPNFSLLKETRFVKRKVKAT